MDVLRLIRRGGGGGGGGAESRSCCVFNTQLEEAIETADCEKFAVVRSVMKSKELVIDN